MAKVGQMSRIYGDKINTTDINMSRPDIISTANDLCVMDSEQVFLKLSVFEPDLFS